MLVLSIIAIVLAGVAIAGVGLSLILQLRAERTLGQLEARYTSIPVGGEDTLRKVNGAETRTKVP